MAGESKRSAPIKSSSAPPPCIGGSMRSTTILRKAPEPHLVLSADRRRSLRLRDPLASIYEPPSSALDVAWPERIAAARGPRMHLLRR